MGYAATATIVMVNIFGVEDSGDYAPMQNGPWFGIGWLACIALFYWFFWYRAGQTVGMRAWRLKLVTTDATPLGSKHIMLRILSAPVSVAACGLGYLWCLFHPNKMAWHDLASATKVVQLPKTEKESKKKKGKS